MKISALFSSFLITLLLYSTAAPTEQPVEPTLCSGENKGACDCSTSADVKSYVLWPKMPEKTKSRLKTNRQRCFHKFEPSVSAAQNKVPVLLAVDGYSQGMIDNPAKLAGKQYGYAVIGVGSTDQDGAGKFGLEFPNNNIVNRANPTPCAHEDSREHAYIKAVLDFIEASETLDETKVYVMGFSQSSMFAAYINVCFASRVTGMWQSAGGLARTGMAPVLPGKQGQCAFQTSMNKRNCCKQKFCTKCEYWPIYPRTHENKIVDCIATYTDDAIACGNDKHMFDAMVAEGNDARLLSFSPFADYGGHVQPKHKMEWVTGCLGIVDSCSPSCETAFKTCMGDETGHKKFANCNSKLADGKLSSACVKTCAPTLSMLRLSESPVVTLSQGKFGTQTTGLAPSKTAPVPECTAKLGPLTPDNSQAHKCVAPIEVLARISAPATPANEAPTPATEAPTPATEAPTPATEAPTPATEAPTPATTVTDAPTPATTATDAPTPTQTTTGWKMLGKGRCVNDAGNHFATLYKKGAAKSELRNLCDTLKGCIAFDIGNNDNGHMRFSSFSALNSAWAKGYRKFKLPHWCRSDCKVATTDVSTNGECWVKISLLPHSPNRYLRRRG